MSETEVISIMGFPLKKDTNSAVRWKYMYYKATPLASDGIEIILDKKTDSVINIICEDE